jgi:hypothetical protein
VRFSLVAAYPWVLVVVGLLGTTLGLDRAFKSKENESRLLMGLGLMGGIAMLALPILVVVRGADYGPIAPFTLLIMLLLGLCLIARAMRRIPITFLVVSAVGLGLLILALQLQGEEVVDKLPLTVVALVILAVLGVVFAVSKVFEAVLDTFLAILGWGPVVAVVAGVAAVQGFLIGTGLSGVGGLAEFL